MAGFEERKGKRRTCLTKACVVLREDGVLTCEVGVRAKFGLTRSPHSAAAVLTLLDQGDDLLVNRIDDGLFPADALLGAPGGTGNTWRLTLTLGY